MLYNKNKITFQNLYIVLYLVKHHEKYTILCFLIFLQIKKPRRKPRGNLSVEQLSKATKTSHTMTIF